MKALKKGNDGKSTAKSIPKPKDNKIDRDATSSKVSGANDLEKRKSRKTKIKREADETDRQKLYEDSSISPLMVGEPSVKGMSKIDEQVEDEEEGCLGCRLRKGKDSKCILCELKEAKE